MEQRTPCLFDLCDYGVHQHQLGLIFSMPTHNAHGLEAEIEQLSLLPIDPSFGIAMGAVTVAGYDTAWPDQFEHISQKLKMYLDRCKVQYLSIEHVGSTAVPGLAAKPNIDMIIEVPDLRNAQMAKEALTHEPPPQEHYKCIGDGGM